MELRAFVSATLLELAQGVRDAQEGFTREKIKGVINPSSPGRGGPVWAIQQVEFDVAVTAVEGSEAKGGVGVVVASIALGSQRKRESSSESVSRVKFAVPMIFPTEN